MLVQRGQVQLRHNRWLVALLTAEEDGYRYSSGFLHGSSKDGPWVLRVRSILVVEVPVPHPLQAPISGM